MKMTLIIVSLGLIMVFASSSGMVIDSSNRFGISFKCPLEGAFFTLIIVFICIYNQLNQSRVALENYKLGVSEITESFNEELIKRHGKEYTNDFNTSVMIILEKKQKEIENE